MKNAGHGFHQHTSVSTRTWRLWIVLACAIAVSVFSSPTRAQQSQELTLEALIGSAVSDIGPQYSDVDKAITRFRNGDFDGARKHLEFANKQHPQLPPVDVTMAKMFIMARNAAQARTTLEEAVMKHPDDPEAYLMLADMAIGSGRVTEAGALYHFVESLTESFDQNAKRKRNFQIRTYAGTAIVADQRKNYDKAISYLKKWIELDPDNSAAHQRLGHALFMTAKEPNQYDAARAEYQTARKLNSQLAHPEVAMATLYHQKDDPTNAKAAFESAVKADGQNVNTLQSYAQWLIETGDSKEAKVQLAKALKLSPDSVEGLFLSGLADRMNKELQAAEEHFLAAHALVPTNRDVINQLALLLLNSEDTKERNRALQFAQMNRQLYQKESEPAITLGWVLYQLNQKRDANTEFQNGIRLGNINADSYYFLSKTQFDEDKLDVAEQFLERALQSRGLFIHRQEAQALLDIIKKRQSGG
ncbi:MAG: tetratricopeptide repeat protein [Pirellulales bacterium]|nr:tetratricopeptide repeat protein [Pirellulales bacterium]